MAYQKCVLLVAFLALFTLIDQTKPVAARKEKQSAWVVKLIKRVEELENRLADIEKCKPCGDRQATVFSFPDKTATGYIDAGTLRKDLDALTACLWLKTSDTQNMAFITYEAAEDVNAFSLFNNGNKLQVISGSYNPRPSSVTITDGKWHHVCVTLGNDEFNLYVDGALEESQMASGIFISKGARLIFGQDQALVAGKLVQEQSFTGEMTGINIWDHVKTNPQISKLAKSCSAGKGNVVSMDDLGEDEIEGGVQMIPSTCKPEWMDQLFINGISAQSFFV